jgi:uncharacterized Zn finger protein
MDTPNLNTRIGLDNSTEIVCESCGNNTFTDVLYLRKVSKLLTGSQDDMVVPLPAFACSKCGHINPEFQIEENSLNKN